MAIKYRLYQDKREGSKSKNLWFARAVTTGTKDLRAIAADIQENVSVKESDVYAVLIELVNVMKKEFAQSHAVKIDRLGHFRVGLRTSPAASAAAFRPNTNIKGTVVNFLPEKQYLNGTGKGKRPTMMLLAGAKIEELEKNAVDTSQPVQP
ncbi:MAG: DNA-binding protein [Prevotella sp.]|nr:DNA-binding protein [Prevotella sp.]